MFGFFSKSKKYIKEYEEEHNITFSSQYKKLIEQDINWYIVKEDQPKETNNFGSLIREGFKQTTHCVCYTDEDYDNYARAILIFYARYVVKTYKKIEQDNLKINEVDMKCRFFKAIFNDPNLTEKDIETILELSKKPDIIIN